MRRPAVALVVLLLAGAPARAGEGERRSAAPPSNVSYVPADDREVRKLLEEVARAKARGDVAAVARGLQAVAGAPPAAVLPVAAGEVEGYAYEAAPFVAHHRVLAEGPAVLAAYEGEYGPRAAAAADDAVARGDAARLARVVDTWAPCAAARRAALRLADVALADGDVDGALGWLERLEDLHAAAAPDVAPALAAEVEARLDRVARAIAVDAAAEARVRARLAALPVGVHPTDPGSGIPRADLAPTTLPAGWPTALGGPARAGVAPKVPPTLQRLGLEELLAPDEGPVGEADGRRTGARPSPWVPPRGVVAGDRLLVSDGRRLHVLSLRTQKYLTRAPIPFRDDGAGEPQAARGLDARERFGWIEGFGLTVAGDAVFAAVPAEVDDPVVVEGTGRPVVAPRADAVVGLTLVETPEGLVARRRFLVDGTSPGLPAGLALGGTPLLYRGALHLAGVRPSPATAEILEAWHVALDPATGAVRDAVLLGTGSPIRRGRADEAVASACAGAHGRVHVCTALGLVAAVDARTGRTLWAYRYDRARPDGDHPPPRLTDEPEAAHRRTSFANQPPLVHAGRVFLTPTDSTSVLALHARPRGKERWLAAWAVDRARPFRSLAVEALVGVTDGAGGVPPVLVAVGQGYGVDVLQDAVSAVVALDPATGRTRWERALPFGGDPEPFGLPLVTVDEVFVPTAHGIARYALGSGDDRPPVVAPAGDDDAGPPYGNLVPWPGRGLVAIGPSRIVVFGARR